MNRRIVLSMAAVLSFILTGCGDGELRSDVEEPISYISWLDGEWQIKDVVTWGGIPMSEDWDKVKSYVGTKYDFTESLGGELSGGVVPIRHDFELQPFFHGQGYISDLDLTGNYYAMFWIDSEEWGRWDTCFVIKNKGEWLRWICLNGIYQLQRTDSAEERVHVYDAKLTFEENIRMRMQEQGIRINSYFSNVWSGNWTIEEIIYTEDMKEARTHLGDTVFYRSSGVDYFDINFIESGEDRVFYHMPTTGELGLEGAYYLLIWDEDSDYPAAIVASEHEMFLIQGNTMFRAVQEEEYLDDGILQGL